MDSAPLKGKVALVTGAGRNIGRAIALALADAGAKVAVNVRASRDEGQAVVDEIVARGGDAVLVVADVTQRTEVDAMIAAISRHFRRLDIVVNNAAIRHEASFADLPYADWRAAQAVCVDGAFPCARPRVHRRHPHIIPFTRPCLGVAATPTKSPAPSCGWRVPAGASLPARRCTSTAAPTWAVKSQPRDLFQPDARAMVASIHLAKASANSSTTSASFRPVRAGT